MQLAMIRMQNNRHRCLGFGYRENYLAGMYLDSVNTDVC